MKNLKKTALVILVVVISLTSCGDSDTTKYFEKEQVEYTQKNNEIKSIEPEIHYSISEMDIEYNTFIEKLNSFFDIYGFLHDRNSLSTYSWEMDANGTNQQLHLYKNKDTVQISQWFNYIDSKRVGLKVVTLKLVKIENGEYYINSEKVEKSFESKPMFLGEINIRNHDEMKSALKIFSQRLNEAKQDTKKNVSRIEDLVGAN